MAGRGHYGVKYGCEPAVYELGQSVFDKAVYLCQQRMQADIFDRIIDADWLSISQFENGDILNRFNNDVNTVASNAVSWLPNLIIYVYSIAATLAVILYYDATMALIALLSAADFAVVRQIFDAKKQRIPPEGAGGQQQVDEL